MEDLLEKLNKQQREAVLEEHNRVCVIAGAGCGKTTTLIYRICFLLLVKKVKAENILVLTFAKKAMEEITKRVSLVLEEKGLNLRIYNSHSFCFNILLKHSYLLGYLSNRFVVYDAEDQQTLVKEFVVGGEDKKKILKAILLINNIKNQKKKENEIVREEKKIFENYQRCLKENKAVDFTDLLILTIKLLSFFPKVCQKYQDEFTHILLDESQDLNEIQWEIVRLLNGEKQNIFVVGDPNQAIYGFQGANPKILLSIANSNIWKTIYLNVNYRSTNNILYLSNSFVKRNKELIQNELVSVRQQINSKVVKINQLWPNNLVEFIWKLKARENLNWGDVAILYRSNFLSASIEHSLRQWKIPYEILGAFDFIKREEVKTVVFLLRAIVDKDDVSLINTLKWQENIGKVTVQKIISLSSEKQLTIYDYLTNLEDTSFFKNKQKEALFEFSKKIQFWNQNLSESAGIEVKDCFQKILDDFVYLDILKKDEDYLKKKRNICQLINMITDWRKDKRLLYFKVEEKEENLIEFFSSFFQWLAVVFEKKDSYQERNNLILSSIHQAKGLEFEFVFLIFLDEDFFPSKRSEDLLEEKRIFYVGLTRAKSKLYLVSFTNRESSFLKQIDLNKENVEFVTFNRN